MTKAYDVYRPSQEVDEEWECIDTVFWANNSTAEEVHRSLIEHDNYPSDIVVYYDNPENPDAYPADDN